jgi:hypothetical protein
VEIGKIEQSRVRDRNDQQEIARSENVEILVQNQIASEIASVSLVNFVYRIRENTERSLKRECGEQIKTTK